MTYQNVSRLMIVILSAIGGAHCNLICAQEFVVESRIETTGEIRAVSDDKITVADSDDKIAVYTIQRKGERAVSIDGGLLNSPAKISVAGKVNSKFLKPQMIVSFTAMLRRGGRSDGEVSELKLLGGDDLDASSPLKPQGGVKEITPPDDSKYAQCEVVGLIQQLKKNRLTVLVPNSPYASKNKIRVTLGEDAVVEIKRDDLKLAQAGDKITKLSALKLTTGHLVVESIEIELQQQREEGAASDVQQDAKYLRLSDEPSKARDVRSQHFLLHTDVSDRQGQMLLDKLETMIGLISQYYGRPSRGLIECYVVRDIQNWPAQTFPDHAREKILEPAGVTMTRSLGRQRKTIVYSCDQHQTVQHEAVHAYCQQAFGSTGPVWYSEGMAEMGAYWKKGQLEVDIQPGVIQYLTNAEPKKMLDIVAAGQVTGDSWQAYAWRWALCHLLANNPNYSSRLKGLGMAMMSGKQANFELTYGDVAPHISFEYDQFVKNFGNGYRADLAAWQWSVKPKKLGSKRATEKILAARGWQATSVPLEKGKSYDIATKGTWQIAKAGEELTADGDSSGKGKLVGALFKDFALSEPFELGAKTTFVPKGEGQLYVRCRDSWTELSDNDGELTLYVRETPEQ